jgi:beta-N-acetylhexosaminidase
VIFSVFGSPYSLQHFEETHNLLCAYEDNEYTQKIVPAILFGGLETKGKLPVSVSGLLRRSMGEHSRALGRLSYATPEDVGMDSGVLARIDEIAHEAIQMKATPGCQILVARKGSIVYQKSFGHLTYDSLQAVTNETVYDIASITKVAATLQVIMFLEEHGLVELDKPIVTYLEDLKGSNKANLTLRNILTHQAGLVSYIPFWRKTVDETGLNTGLYSAFPVPEFNLQVASGMYAARSLQDSVWQWIKQSDLLPLKKGKKTYEYKYSDLGYYIMQRIAEKQLNQPMGDFLAQNFYEPLGLSTMTYLPLCKYPLQRIAPTEQDNLFRNTLVCGMVHDQGAAMFGGIAGHAGIFSNARDLATLMQMNLQDGEYGGRRYLAPGTVAKFAKTQFKDNRRGLGWDKPALDDFYGPTSNLVSPATFGHTGFTGTAAWVDPEFDLVYIFLSNRIHPDAENTKLIKYSIRTRIQDEIYKSIQDFAKYNIIP